MSNIVYRPHHRTDEKLLSAETRPAVEKAREMLALGIDIQAAGDATNAVVTGIVKSLLDHIDELEADLECAIAVGRYAAATARPDPIDIRERAAKVAEDHMPATQDMISTQIAEACEAVAAAIRALPLTPEGRS